MKFGYTINNKLMMNSNGKLLIKAETIDPYNPLGLPPYTIRVLMQPNLTPTFSNPCTQVSVEPNIWDVTYVNNLWDRGLLSSPYDHRRKVYSVLGANTENITSTHGMLKGCTALSSVEVFDTSKVNDMAYMFYGCDSLTSIPLFNTSNVTGMERFLDNCRNLINIPLLDTKNVVTMENMFSYCKKIETLPLLDTSNVTSMYQMCLNCSSLKSIPLFNTNKVSDISWAFNECRSVDTGALALYNQASTQATPPVNHSKTFTDCGMNSQTGSAELDLIPSDWK